MLHDPFPLASSSHFPAWLSAPALGVWLLSLMSLALRAPLVHQRFHEGCNVRAVEQFTAGASSFTNIFDEQNAENSRRNENKCMPDARGGARAHSVSLTNAFTCSRRVQSTSCYPPRGLGAALLVAALAAPCAKHLPDEPFAPLEQPGKSHRLPAHHQLHPGSSKWVVSRREKGRHRCIVIEL